MGRVEESHLLHDTYIFMTFLSTILRITNNIKVLRKNRLGKWKREINRIKKKKKHFACSRPFKLIKNKNSQNKIPFPQYDPKKNSNPPYRRSSSPNKTNFFFSSPNSNSPFHASNLISLINPTQTFLSLSLKKTNFQARFEETKHWVYRARAVRHEFQAREMEEQRAGGGKDKSAR